VDAGVTSLVSQGVSHRRLAETGGIGQEINVWSVRAVRPFTYFAENRFTGLYMTGRVLSSVRLGLLSVRVIWAVWAEKLTNTLVEELVVGVDDVGRLVPLFSA
jgi:hypothetical protein